MKMTLSKLKIHPDMSEETTCFSANILLDGKIIGEVANKGCGGCNSYYWKDRTKGELIEGWANAQRVIVPAGHGMEAFELDFEKLDHFIDELMVKMDLAVRIDAQHKRWCKKSLVFRLKGDAPDSFRTSKTPYSAEIKAGIVKKYGDQIEIILNENMPPLEIPFLEVSEVKGFAASMLATEKAAAEKELGLLQEEYRLTKEKLAFPQRDAFGGTNGGCLPPSIVKQQQ